MSEDPTQKITQALAQQRDSVSLLLLAQDPSAPSHVLEKLSESKEPEVLRALAKNPNTPQDVLFVLGERYTSDFLENPILPLWFLEQPDLLPRLPLHLLRRMLFYPLPREWLLQIAQHANDRVLYHVAKRKDLWPELLSALAYRPSESAQLPAAKNPLTPPEALAWLLSSEHSQVRTAALQNPKAPKEMYQLLAKACGDPDLKENKNIHAALSVEEFFLLAEQGLFAQQIVAEHPGAPVEILERFADSENYLLRANVAKNPSLPDEAASALSMNVYTDIRAALLQRPTLPSEIIERLANDANNNVKLAYINSRHIPKEELINALRDVAPAISPHAAFHTLSFETIGRLFVDIHQEHEWFALVSQLPTLERFFLFHPQAPASLWRASRDEAVIYNTATSIAYERELPEEIVVALSERREVETQLISTRSKRCPSSTLEGFATSNVVAIRVTVAAHTNTPPATLEALGQDKAVAVRRSVAKNPNTNNDLLLRLTKDEDQQTKRNALRTLNEKNLLL